MTNTYHNELEHNDALQLLPWHVQGTLDEHEAQAMSSHIEHCAQCRQEAREMRQMLAVAGQRSGEVDERRLDALMHRIEAFEQHHSDAPASRASASGIALPGPQSRGAFSAWWRWLADLLSMRAVVLPLGGVAATLLAVAIVTMMPPGDPPLTGEYAVHSSAPSVNATGPGVNVTFISPPDAQQLDVLAARPGIAQVQARSATEYLVRLDTDAGIAAISALVSDLDEQPGVAAVSIENGTP